MCPILPWFRAVPRAFLLACSLTQAIVASEIHPDEVVVFFPTAASLSEDHSTWSIPVHGWIFEPEQDELFRSLLIGRLLEELGEGWSPAEREVFEHRIRPFLVDNERNKCIRIRLNESEHSLPPSGDNGHFRETLHLHSEALRGREATRTVPFTAILDTDDARRFAGTVYLTPPKGLTIISDIDDTIKISEVRSRRELLRNTFLRPFRPVEGMPEKYRAWAEAGATFHYVSASPWQLYEALSTFLQDAKFPEGVFHLRNVRLKDRSIASLLKSPADWKTETVREIVARFPGHQFVFVGDSGEHDPEVYGAIAREYPQRVEAIFIRDVTQEARDAPRYASAFRGIPPDRWRLFTDPGDLVLSFAENTAD